MTTAKKSPRAGKDTIYVDPDDEITSIIDKVEAAKQKVVALVLPKRFTTLQSIVNMKLLKRGADNAGKNVVLITSEAALLPLAGATGLHVAKNLQSKPEIPPAPVVEKETPKAEEVEVDEKEAKLDHHRSIGELAAAGAIAEESIDLEDEKTDEPAPKPKKNKKLKVPDFDRFRLMLGLGIGGLLAFIVFIILATSVWPRATVTIQTTSNRVSADFNMTTSDKAESLNQEEKVIPAELRKTDQTATTQIQATGERNDGKKASGSVTMTAQRCAPNIGTPPSVPAGTGVSSGGKIFITQSTASFSFAGASGSCVDYSSGAVGITAQGAGADYNVNNANFSVVGRSDVSATGSTSGGTDDIVKILSQQDVENAKKKISSEESDEFSRKFQEDLEKEGLYIVESTLKLSEPAVTSNPSVGQEAETANATVKITYSALVMPKEELQKLINGVLESQIDKDKQQLSEGDILERAAITVVNQGSGASATLNVAVETTAVPKIDQALIKQQIGGKKTGEIREIVSAWPGVRDVKVDFSPFWVSKAPGNPGKIIIKMEQVQQENQEESGN